MKISDLVQKPGTTEEAQQKIDSLRQEHEKLNGKIQTLDEEVRALQHEAGESSLQDALEGTSTTGAVRRKLWNKEKEMEAKKQALQKIEGHIRKAEREKILAEAQQKRKKANRLSKEAEGIEKERDKHLKELQRIEGCEFTPYINTRAPHIPIEATSNEIAEKYVEPLTSRLRRQAEGLTQEAERLEKQVQGAKQVKGAMV